MAQVGRSGFRSRRNRAFLAACLSAVLAAGLAVGPLDAAVLKPNTAAAFDTYIRVTETQMERDLVAGKFLVVDRLPDLERQKAYAELQRGQLYIAPLATLDEGRPLRVPDGLIHHWAGAVFLPGVTLDQVESVLEDYGAKTVFYRPEVQQAHVLSQSSETIDLFMRLYYKSLVTVVYDATFEMHPARLNPTEELVRAYSTRIAQVKDPSQPGEHELSVGRDDGFLWRLYSYWRIEEKDGGVYLGLETVALSRGIPAVFEPLVRPLTESIPRKLLTDLLQDTRAAVGASVANQAAAGPGAAR